MYEQQEPAGFEPTPPVKRMRSQRSDRKRSAAAKSETLWRKKTRHLKRVSRIAPDLKGRR